MNERMIELYKEASEFAYKICKDEGRAGGPTDHIWNTLSTGKFAELIVQECIEQVEVFNVRMDARPRHIVEAIKSHFGVEE